MAELTELLPATRAALGRRTGAFIDGAFAPDAGTSAREIIDPATGDTLAEVLDADDATVDRAVVSARAAFEDGRWSTRAPSERERVMHRFADLIADHAEELAQLETLNQGKSLGLARGFDVGWSVGYLRYVAGLPTKTTGDALELSQPPPGLDYTAWTRREAIGVVAGIAPWNFPLAIALWKVAPALAAGCTAVLKPSELTPLTALRFAELAVEAGLPDGCLNVVPGSGPGAGAALCAHRDVAKISFTGSVATGKAVGRAALDTLARCTLELGGKNPAVFCEDVDVEAALPAALVAAYLNQGQVCAAASRFYVHRKVLDRLVGAMSAAIGAMRIGPGLDLSAEVTPLVSQAHRDRVQAIIRTVERDLAPASCRAPRRPSGAGSSRPGSWSIPAPTRRSSGRRCSARWSP